MSILEAGAKKYLVFHYNKLWQQQNLMVLGLGKKNTFVKVRKSVIQKEPRIWRDLFA